MGSTGADVGNSIAVDAAGFVYTTGDFVGTVDFNPDPAITSNVTSAGGRDIFISKLNAAGNFVVARQMGGISTDVGTSLVLDAARNIYITGYFNAIADFDPNPVSTFNLTAVFSDIFAVKLSQGTSLPVTLSGFSVQNNRCTANLKWTTATEQNSKHFEVQHSTDGVTFTTIGVVPSSGNSSTPKHYSYNTNLSSQNNYFRLHMVDVDGSSKFSPVVSVNSNCNSNVIVVFPNPARSMITVNGLSGENHLRLLDAAGKVLRSTQSSNTSETINIGNLAAGTYILQIVQNNSVIENIKVIKE